VAIVLISVKRVIAAQLQYAATLEQAKPMFVCYLSFRQSSSKKRGSSMNFGRVVPVVFIVMVGFSTQAYPGPDITSAVSNECRWDYHNFCSEYGIGSPLLTYCFRNNGAKLSRGCVNALIAAGDVSKTYVQARRRAHH
jgi:hypothetical protein